MSSLSSDAIKAIQFELLKNIQKEISTSDLLIKNTHRTLTNAQIINIARLLPKTFMQTSYLKCYLKFKDLIEKLNFDKANDQTLQNLSCDEINNTGVFILKNQSQFELIDIDTDKEYIINLASMFFRLAYEKALKLHVKFHYYGFCLYYNAFLLQTLSQAQGGLVDFSYLDDAFKLCPQFVNDFYIPKNYTQAIHNLEKINTLQPDEFIKLHSQSDDIDWSAGLIICSSSTKSKHDYINVVFNKYKDGLLNANPREIKKFEQKLQTAIKMLQMLILTSKEHHLHYHKSCADILYNAFVCDCILNRIDMAIDCLTKALEFEKSNTKNDKFLKNLNVLSNIYIN
jgi:hypothetical protein